jgi:hypothetical protein
MTDAKQGANAEQAGNFSNLPQNQQTGKCDCHDCTQARYRGSFPWQIDQALQPNTESLRSSLAQREAELVTLRKQLADEQGWKESFEMYRRAWLRSIGGTIVRKSHEIDGFVLRTEEVYKGYRNWVAHTNGLIGKDPFWNVPEPGEAALSAPVPTKEPTPKQSQ